MLCGVHFTLLRCWRCCKSCWLVKHFCISLIVTPFTSVSISPLQLACKTGPQCCIVTATPVRHSLVIPLVVFNSASTGRTELSRAHSSAQSQGQYSVHSQCARKCPGYTAPFRYQRTARYAVYMQLMSYYTMPRTSNAVLGYIKFSTPQLQQYTLSVVTCQYLGSSECYVLLVLCRPCRRTHHMQHDDVHHTQHAPGRLRTGAGG